MSSVLSPPLRLGLGDELLDLVYVCLAVQPQVAHVAGAAELVRGVGGARGVPLSKGGVLQVSCPKIEVLIRVKKQLGSLWIKLVMMATPVTGPDTCQMKCN